MTTDTVAWPVKTAEVRSAMFDSTRWDAFDFRDDDIVIATYSKSGTTLTQQMVGQLVFDGDATVHGMDHSPWIDCRPWADAVEIARAQTHRRFLKTHLPIEALVYSPKAKYIVVGRDARDVIWSWHNHLLGAKPEFRGQMHQTAQIPPSPDVRRFYHDFLDGPAQSEPIWPHIQGWWNARALPNLLTLHYADIIADMPGQFRRLSGFLDIPLDEAKLPTMVSNCSLAHMRKLAANDPMLSMTFENGAATFINKGTNGRWRDVLSQAEIDKCDEIAARELTPECAAWLRDGTWPAV
jgi:aryl sulfotransferase